MNTSENNDRAQDNIQFSEKIIPVRKRLVFTIVALALLMTTVDATIVATALHTMQRELHTSINWAGWALTAYSFGFVVMLPISGKYSEQFGNRRIFLISISTFTIASLFCGWANDIYTLIALRVVQAAGGAGITPSVTGIIVNHFGSARDRAVSLFGSVFPIGAMIGPIFGGLFVTYWTWRGIFFVNIPIGIAVIALSLRYIPSDIKNKIATNRKRDTKGVLLMGIGILSAMFAASYLGEQDSKLFSFPFLALVIISIVGLSLFIMHINRREQPLIMPRFVYGKGFGPVNLTNILFGGITQGIIALVPLYAANRYGINALDSGTLLVAEGIAAVALSTIMTMALRRTGYRPPLYVGSIIIIIGTVLLAVPPILNTSPYVWLAFSAFLIGAGSGTINPSCRNAGLQLAPEHSSTIAALRSMCLQLGSIVTIAVATAIITGTHNPGSVQAWVNAGAAFIILLSIPLISRIPEHHGAW